MRNFEIAIPSDCVVSEEAELNQQALTLMQRVLKAKIIPSTELEFEGTKISLRDSTQPRLLQSANQRTQQKSEKDC
jgi:hypothetical protein